MLAPIRGARLRLEVIAAILLHHWHSALLWLVTALHYQMQST